MKNFATKKAFEILTSIINYLELIFQYYLTKKKTLKIIFKKKTLTFEANIIL